MAGSLIALLSLAIVLVGFRVGATYAETKQRELFLDRLNDTSRLASVAEEALDAGDKDGLQAELDRLELVFGIHSAVLDRGASIPFAATGSIDVNDTDVHARIFAAEAGVREVAQKVILPWNPSELTIAEPVSRNGDIVGVVVTSSPTGDLHNSMLWGWSYIALIGVVALVAFGALIQGFTRWVLKPVLVLDSTAHRLASGRFDVRVPPAGGPPELRRLATSFNEMADAVETSRDQQRAFVADASHQMRNPLNALLLHLQYLEITGPTDLAVELRAAEAEGWRLARLVDQLLILARAEQNADTTTDFDLYAVVLDRCDAIHARVEAQAVHLVVGGQSAPAASVRGDSEAVGRALDELLDNAIKYTPRGGVVDVQVTQHDDTVIVAVVDQGGGLADDEWELAGNRFWRSPQSQNVPGFGLGLSIASTLVQRSGGRLDLAPGPSGRGVTARLIFNASGPDHGLTDR
jgi:signal transduction histidine kinase